MNAKLKKLKILVGTLVVWNRIGICEPILICLFTVVQQSVYKYF